jgi:hypothetical protein
MALGASGGNLVRLTVGRGMRPVVLGILIGAVVAAAAGGYVSGMLFETSGRDPLVIGAVAVMLFGVGIVASLLPGLRAARADPMAALRAD